MLKPRAAIESSVSTDLEKVKTINKLLVDRENLMGCRGERKKTATRQIKRTEDLLKQIRTTLRGRKEHIKKPGT